MKTSTSFRSLTLLAGVALAILATPSLHAAVLVNYDFTGSPSAAVPTTVDADVTATNTTWTGLSGNSGFSTASDTAYARADDVASTFNSGRYLQFTITADPGLFLNLDSLEFTLGGQNTAATGTTYTVNTNVRSNAEVVDYSTNLTINPGTVTTASHTVLSGNNTTYSNFSVDLSGVAFDNLTTITFRLFPTDSLNATGNYLRYSDITLNGTVAVPEPGTVSLLLFGCVGLLFLRRLHSKKSNTTL